MSGEPPFDDETWDEERWEAFLREHDRRVDRYMDLIFRFMHKHPRPDPEAGEAFDAWKAALRAFLQEEGWRREDLGLPLFWLEEEHAEDEIEEDPFAAGGEDYFGEGDAGEGRGVHHLPVYRHASELSRRVLDWAYALSGDVKDSTLVHFCSHVTQIPANIARGHAIGLERDALGGNIACAKRGLSEANAALDTLRRMKTAPYMDAATYRRLYEQAFEVRNELGLFIQDLRDRFNLGID